MNTSSHFLLGLLFVGALSVLGYFTLFLSDFTLFGEVHRLTVHFPDANGLREGDSVLVAGVRWGKVATITYDPETTDPKKRITVLLSLDKQVILHVDHEFMIEDATLLGGKNLTIDPGSADAAVVELDAILFGEVQLNVVEAAGKLISNNGEALTETIATLRNMIKDVEEGRGGLGKIVSDQAFADDLSRLIGDAANTATNMEKITAEVEHGQGTLGRLIMQDEMYVLLQELGRDFDSLLEEATSVVTDVRDGKGLIGAALNDEEMSENTKAGIRNLREIIEGLNRGEGTIGVLLKQDQIALDIRTVMKRLAEGEGSLGRLFAEDELYENFRIASSDLRDVVAQVRDGRGTVGKLIMEEGLYTELLKAVGLLTRSLEEYREAAPISSMTSVIFGAF